MTDLPALPLEAPGFVFAVLMAIVLVAPVLAERLRIPGIVGLIVIGTLVGPNVAGLLERDGVVAVLGSAGLLYLMFVAGLELDLDELRTHRRDSLVFGGLTFAIPMLLGVVLILPLGYGALAAVLLASCWASHTLLTYPVFRRFGVATNRAVAASVGATIITDTAALLVLVVVARASGGGLDARFWLELTVGLVVLVATTMVALPRVARWFFANHGQDRNARMVFLLAGLFASSAVAELAGVEGIIGAFLAGLSLNRMVPEDSVLMGKVDVVGSTLLIPLFLISVGMLVDPMLLLDPRILGLTAAFTGIALGAKWLAAEGAGRLFGYVAAERQAMFALSGAQAAATLAAVFVGLEVGLLDTGTVNAVVGVILLTCLTTSWVAGRAAPRLPAPDRTRSLGQVVVVPIARPSSAGPLAALAAALARSDGGMVLPVTVVPPHPEPSRLREATRLGAEAEQVALRTGVEAHGVVRVDTDAASGIHHASVEHGASLLVVGWKSGSSDASSLFGGLIDDLVRTARIPTLVARIDAEAWPRIVVKVATHDTEPAGLPGLRLALSVAARLARSTSGPVRVVAEQDDDPALRELVATIAGRDAELVHRGRRPGARLADHVDPDDLVVVASEPLPRQLRAAVSGVLRRLPDAQLVVAVEHAPATAELPDLTGLIASPPD
ncbi:MAG: cation:proton antiporter [Actinobacteria bacterium]|nr:cation:proton antiporter [Actinomycetota bacterium]